MSMGWITRYKNSRSWSVRSCAPPADPALRVIQTRAARFSTPRRDSRGGVVTPANQLSVQKLCGPFCYEAFPPSVHHRLKNRAESRGAAREGNKDVRIEVGRQSPAIADGDHLDGRIVRQGLFIGPLRP